MGRTNSQANFWSDFLGWQYTIANLTAALALAQVERVDELIAKKREIFSWYDEKLGKIPGIKMIREPQGSIGNYCYPSLLLEESITADRDQVLRKLKELNVHCRPGFPRMSRMPHFTQPPRFENPVASQVEKRGISMAAAGNLTQEDIYFACEALLEAIKN
jgi:perosamine synthetase